MGHHDFDLNLECCNDYRVTSSCKLSYAEIKKIIKAIRPEKIRGPITFAGATDLDHTQAIFLVKITRPKWHTSMAKTKKILNKLFEKSSSEHTLVQSCYIQGITAEENNKFNLHCVIDFES